MAMDERRPPAGGAGLRHYVSLFPATPFQNKRLRGAKPTARRRHFSPPRTDQWDEVK